MQVMALTAMEKPVTLNSEDMRCAHPVVSPAFAMFSPLFRQPKPAPAERHADGSLQSAFVSILDSLWASVACGQDRAT
jgi:hypothetical protein